MTVENDGQGDAGQPAGAQAQARILVVDDSPANVRHLEVLLRTEYTVVSASNGPDGLALAGEAIRPDLILLDIMMPGMDGFEVLNRLKATPATRSIPVLFLTALEDAATEARGLELGAADYLTKPVVPAVLRARIHTHLALKAHRERLEELAEIRARQLVHAERLSTMGILTAGIMHEINSPLTFVQGFAEILHADMERLRATLPARHEDELACLSTIRQFLEKGCTYAANIAEGGQRIHRIMESMRRFSHRGQTERSATSLEACIENALALCHNVLKYRVTVHKDIDSPLPLIVADAQQLEQVFVNLFKNAADAVVSQPAATLNIVLRRTGTGIRCQVEDDGPGLAAGDLERIWEPFFTTKGSDIGTGLGLSVSRGIIEGHGGRIWAENREPGPGARFVIELPALAQAEPA